MTLYTVYPTNAPTPFDPPPVDESVPRQWKFNDLTGQRYGRLTVLRRDLENHTIGTKVYWWCECACGIIKSIERYGLTSGKVISCGCYKKEMVSRTHRKHGYSGRVGGRNRHPLYGIWIGMRQRCNSPQSTSYKNYGGRGIKVCARWDDFENFLIDMGERPSKRHWIGRKDHNGDYEPSNCCWSLQTDELRNTRRSHYVTYNGKTQTVAEWAREMGIPMATLSNRINMRGWSIERALTTPPRNYDD